MKISLFSLQGGKNTCFIPAPTGSWGNQHKGYMEAIVFLWLKSSCSDFSFASKECENLCVHLFWSVCTVGAYVRVLTVCVWLDACVCVCVDMYGCRLVEWTSMARLRKRW